ncbi:hypothetical protein [Oceanomicrobium pacificus]|uniref:Uncharacterized protein n=1 Tax=Oceanomicrobium pacificus TaxID=2692916 RepID=A0A6B0U2U4_9RHOB|nr:hypothetical protein [Oceanomicrobium pacificus]MXU65311.1 hypothetical protein [Oceanomicrobium pacificus]
MSAAAPSGPDRAPDAAEIEAMFTQSDGSFRFARWGRPVAPVVFGTDDATLTAFKDGFAEVARLTGQALAETDPEMGANLMVFVCPDWAELRGVPDLDRLLPGLDDLIPRLDAAAANQFRSFSFEPDGAIRFSTVLLRMDDSLAAEPALDLAMRQMVLTSLLWGPSAFRSRAPVGHVGPQKAPLVPPAVAALIRAAYDPVLPAAATDASHSLRLAARTALLMEGLQ